MDPDKIVWKYVKMSKSKRNVVTPDAMAEKFGADALRTYELFVAPFEDAVQWNEDGMNGAFRFMGRVWRLVNDYAGRFDPNWRGARCRRGALEPGREGSAPQDSTRPSESGGGHRKLPVQHGGGGADGADQRDVSLRGDSGAPMAGPTR